MEILQGKEFLLPSSVTGEIVYNTDAPFFYLWYPEQSYIVLGKSQKIEAECIIENIKNIPVLKREAGGGAVVLSPHTICLAIRFRRTDKNQNTNFLTEGANLLQTFFSSYLNTDLPIKGHGDLTINNNKILGSSLRVKKKWAVYLASIIVEDNLKEVNHYLKSPSRKPSYRRNRTHSDFITSLKEHFPMLDKKLLKENLQLFLEKQLPYLKGDKKNLTKVTL